jgi:hypothetical protein
MEYIPLLIIGLIVGGYVLCILAEFVMWLFGLEPFSSYGGERESPPGSKGNE